MNLAVFKLMDQLKLPAAKDNKLWLTINTIFFGSQLGMRWRIFILFGVDE